jgi:cell division protease FtsH
MTMAPQGAPAGVRPEAEMRPRARRQTRKPLAPWDRIKFLLLLAVVWFILVWSVMASDPIVGFSDAMRIEVHTGWWVFVLAGLEAVRQVHYLISEHWVGYHRFWIRTFFGGIERTTHRTVSSWTLFRVGRALVWLLVIAVVAAVAGKVTHASPLVALMHMPAYIWHALPFILQLLVVLLFVVLQFAAIF